MVSYRLRTFVRRGFRPEEAEAILSLLTDAVPQEPGDSADGIERVQAAVVLLSDGDSQRFLEVLRMAQQDWRDVLVAAQLAHDDWPERLDAVLG
ncbi:hypothetical protein [Actinoplanes sp. NPDC026619]|uniref:hypothetical protein n=1 Tax=Actinoplanes sp. NPDC026619 TaxID=3155798 RepID=UPI0033D58634